MSSTASLARRAEGEAGLGTRAARSGFTVTGGRLLQGLVGVVFVVALARLLTPAEFGVLAMVYPIALMVGQILNRGLHFAVLHEMRLTPAQVRRLFWKAQRFNVVLLGAMTLSAPLLARFYGEPRVTLVTVLWAISLAFQGVASFPETTLKLKLRFGVVTAIQLTGILCGGIAAVGAAAMGFTGVALVLQIVVWQVVRCAIAFALTRWSPGLPVSDPAADRELDELVRYSTNLATSRTLTWFGRQGDRMVVGYVSGAAALGLYDSARRWSWYPFQELYFSTTEVVVASLSQARHDAVAFREYCRRGFNAFLLLPLPAIAFVGVEADRVVRALLGEGWLGVIPMVRVLCVAAFFDSLGRLTMWLYAAEGTTRDQLFWSVVTAVVTLGSVLMFAHEGVEVVTLVFAVATGALAIPGIAYCLRTSRLSGGDFLRAVWRPSVATIVAALVWMLLEGTLPIAGLSLPLPSPLVPLPTAPFLALLIAGPLFLGIYALLWLALPGGRAAAHEILQVVRTVR